MRTYTVHNAAGEKLGKIRSTGNFTWSAEPTDARPCEQFMTLTEAADYLLGATS